MADQKVTELPIKNQSAINLADYLFGIDAAEGYQMLISDLAKKIIEDFTGSTLGGSSQALKTIIDAINTKIGNTAMGTTATTITGAIKEHETDISTLNGKTDLSSSFTNSLSTAPESVSIIKKGNVVHVVIMYPSITVANDTQIGTLPSSIKSTSTTIFKVVNRTSGALISGTCWALAGINAIRYYGTAISSTRIMIEGIMSLDT